MDKLSPLFSVSQGLANINGLLLPPGNSVLLRWVLGTSPRSRSTARERGFPLDAIGLVSGLL